MAVSHSLPDSVIKLNGLNPGVIPLLYIEINVRLQNLILERVLRVEHQEDGVRATLARAACVGAVIAAVWHLTHSFVFITLTLASRCPELQVHLVCQCAATERPLCNNMGQEKRKNNL